MPSPHEPRKAVSFRIQTALVARMRRHIRDHAGKPMYLALATFLESAIEREIQRTSLIAAGALPPDAPDEGAADAVASRRAVLDHTLNNQPLPLAPGGCTGR